MLLYKRRYPALKGCWEDIGAELPMRDTQAIYHRARRLLILQTVKQGPWSDHEVKQLLNMVATIGPNWVEVGAALNRLDSSCRDRYRHYIEDKAIKKRTPFTEKEVETLHALIDEFRDEHGIIAWSKLSKHMPDRSAAQCYYYW